MEIKSTLNAINISDSVSEANFYFLPRYKTFLAEFFGITGYIGRGSGKSKKEALASAKQDARDQHEETVYHNLREKAY